MSEAVWASILSAIPDVEAWNVNMPRLVHENGSEFKAFAQAEAAKRGYMWSALAKGYVNPWTIHACRGKNLIGAGWRSGQLAVIFASKEGPRRYESVKLDVPREVCDKLVNNPFPDRLYSLIVKDKIQMQRVG
jgi:hypothetical protein